ncbi:porin [Glaciimonas sp. PCH181]|uniref:porin n=1 Tax=Glaciimonas sp. PCH181 TaxID=2133943 RepID=UPI00137531B0|nr:porin [Glaciimonas sp. PCH181]
MESSLVAALKKLPHDPRSCVHASKCAVTSNRINRVSIAKSLFSACDQCRGSTSRRKESGYSSNRLLTAALAAVALTSLYSNVYAQTSVTVYGVVDTYVAHDRGGNPAGSVTTMEGAAASLAGSRLGFKGSEDLGGGLAAIFTAEMGFGSDTGAFDGSGIGFGRQAFVGLQGNLGVLKLGRQYNPLFTGGYQYDPFLGTLEGYYNRVISLGAGKRLSNTILYGTPANLGGFSGEISYSLGEVVGSISQGRNIGLQVGYVNGPFSTNLLYNNFNNSPATATTPAAMAAPVVNTKNVGIGAAYNFGIARLSGLYQSNKNDDPVAALETRDFLVGVSVPFGRHKLLASYIKQKNKALTNADTTQIALGYTYSLSKRTTLYTSFARIANDGAASIATPDSRGGTDKVFNAGIDHTF